MCSKPTAGSAPSMATSSTSGVSSTVGSTTSLVSTTSVRSADTSGTGASGATSASFASSSAVSATSTASSTFSTCSIGASGSSGFAGSTSPAMNDRIHASSAFQTIAKLLSTSAVSLPDFASSATTVPKKKNCSSRCDSDFKPSRLSSSIEPQKNSTKDSLTVETSRTGTSSVIFGSDCGSSASISRSHSQS